MTSDEQCLAHKLVKAHLNIGNWLPANVSTRETPRLSPSVITSGRNSEDKND